ncbi:exosortase B [Denitromonas iodatirespirans]|uniref:Exosortase B n=1 Tax=Denitromonas iodatirespirans TaxID=2795389 RepID=A0A944DCX7_DENI1|nr:exosortase B [Denitromonas iodatirespirans]MBT0962766.1 exosortase B [Denitromonas iodatirespirans]
MTVTASSPTAQAPGRADLAPWLIVALGLAIMYVPSFVDLFRTIWSTDEQAHGPIVLGLSVWLVSRKWQALASMPASGARPALAWPVMIVAGLFYALGRSQGILIFEVGSLVWMIAGLLLLLRGPAAVRLMWFALFFMLFMIPLPGVVVDTLTAPMKMAVSYVAEQVLYAAGYPIARTGVMLQIGQYQLLVADACAGLHTLFTLEALGLLYLNVVRHASVLRNITLAILIVPISFTANVIRVMVLTLITYHLGDEAGQGFLHGFSGMALFVSALLLIIAADSVLRIGVKGRAAA